MLAPLVSQQQGTQTAVNLLTVAGLDVTLFTPTPWTVEEAAPGYVSAMSFTIEDTTGTIGVNIGDVVVCWDVVRDAPRFTGYAMTPSFRPWPSGTGRWIDVRAFGVEAILDWTEGPAYTFTSAGTGDFIVSDVIQRLIARAAIPPAVPLRAVVSGANQYGDLAGPIGSILGAISFNAGTFAIEAGSLRQQITSLWNLWVKSAGGTPIPLVLTVDFYGGLRCFYLGGPTASPADWTTLTITDGATGTAQAETLIHTVEGAAAIRGVVVTGGNAAGSGVVMDGTGRPGPMTTYSDATILTSDAMYAAASWAIASSTETARGSFSQIARVPVSSLHPGGVVQITDSNIPLSAARSRIGTIVKTVQGGGVEDWQITYGGSAPSFSDTVASGSSHGAKPWQR